MSNSTYYKKYFWTFGLVALIVLVGRWKLSGNSAQSSVLLSSPATTATTPAPSYSSPSLSAPSTRSSAAQSTSKYRDGVYTGQPADAYYGNIQLQLTVTQGKISKVDILDYPRDNRTSQSINNQVLPQLQNEVLQVQGGPVDAVSGASFTSQAFNAALETVLSQAQNV